MKSLIGSIWRHIKTGHVYAITGTCRLEHSNEPAYLYCRPEDGVTWARNMDQFLDGRFERLDEDHPFGGRGVSQ